MPEATALKFADLLVPAPYLVDAPPRFSVDRELSEPLAAQVEANAVSRQGLPDTIFFAAWLLLLRHWLGGQELTVQERWVRPEGGDLIVTGACVVDLEVTAETWIRELDQKRRDGSGHASSSALAEATWLRDDAAELNPTFSIEQGPVIGLKSQGVKRHLFLDAPISTMDPLQAEAILSALVQTAAALLANPTSRLRDVDTLGHEQRQRLFEHYNAPVSALDPTVTVHGLFARQVALRADAVALAYRGARMSYGELDADSNRIAHALRSAGVAPGNTVCVALGRSMQSIVALLGVLKAGAAYLPVDAAYPKERIAFMLADASASLVLTTTEHRGAFADVASVLLVDALPADVAVPGPVSPDAATGQSLAYVMYTSGSTGTPKGIEIRHHSIARLVIGSRYVDLSPDAAVMHAAPLGFDASTLEIWGPLLNGGRCVLHDEDLPTAAGLSHTIRTERVTAAWLTAALFNAVVDDDPTQLRGLRQLLIGGEALSVPHVRRALAALPDVTIINGYGPTECTTFTTTCAIPRDLPRTLGPSPSGGRSRTRRSTSSVRRCSRCRPAWWASCMSAATGWHAAT